MARDIIILGIESSCDDTSAAVSLNDKILANVVAAQPVHTGYGGVVPELASRAHQQKIVSVIDEALRQANINKKDLSAVACTTGPGLMGSLLVGVSFAKGYALASGIPIIGVNHMQAHIMAHFVSAQPGGPGVPSFPFLCLTVSGGHTQLVLVRDHFDMTLIGETLDDAAGEAFDKVAKLLGLPYPGGPVVDKLAKTGNPEAFRFPHPNVPGLNFSFSGLKTSVLYFIQKQQAADSRFVENHLADICASVQATIVAILVEKTMQALNYLNINTLAISGGVSANSALRDSLQKICADRQIRLHIPPFSLCTDNAAMIAVTGYYKYLKGVFDGQDLVPEARFSGLA